ncbi:exodeoxyribonuclease VII large subunit [Enterovibrio sp. ZSDZ35]|uniref:Exodeoxyribonuclease 7 large subunit n=1 Tax=Enterovibrio qingdaonensis TaxID=2899818 RepID=A0ABT5QR98_9GAMM|nr:exodeoxyribonuclease VII large subunit [Enterovibrio sp. ZSDZ35]MDD1783505.1 exodeoxyribonuclease VII large subunit [Enterovibrio sp. ZSDZ35]
MTLSNENIYTVSRLNAEVRLLLENEMGIVWLVGEISNLTVPVSGHWYFTLKDRQAQVKCAMFRGNNRRVTFKPVNGNQVLVRARLSLYEPRGDYQIIVESMQPEGDGMLQQQFEKLKMQLSAEGLFAASTKKPLPEQPKRVGIITSSTGAALHDILHVLKRRDPSLPVVIYPTQVQGKDAAIQIAQAIGRANSRDECDVLIVGRGGGSLEDLWCFNEEIVARTIAASTIPIVSAVGHEVDVTIADFVADVRAPTPSAAAELVSRDTSLRSQQLLQRTDKLAHRFESQLSFYRDKLTRLQHRLTLQHPQARLQQQAQQFDDLEYRLNLAMRTNLQREAQRIDRLSQKLEHYSPVSRIRSDKVNLAHTQEKLIEAMKRQLRQQQHTLALHMETLDAVSPLATLARGYSITRDAQGAVIRSGEAVKEGDLISTTVADGEIRSRVI